MKKSSLTEAQRHENGRESDRNDHRGLCGTQETTPDLFEVDRAEAVVSIELRRTPDEGWNHQNHQWTPLSKNLGVSVSP